MHVRFHTGFIQTNGSFKSFLLAADAECVQTDVHTTDCWQRQSMLVTYHPLYMYTYEPCEAEASYSIPALLFRHLLLLLPLGEGGPLA